jgi:hypothetical protein
MADNKSVPNHESIVISLRLPPDLARDFRTEAARRDMRLIKLFGEMWEQYKKADGRSGR